MSDLTLAKWLEKAGINEKQWERIQSAMTAHSSVNYLLVASDDLKFLRKHAIRVERLVSDSQKNINELKRLKKKLKSEIVIGSAENALLDCEALKHEAIQISKRLRGGANASQNFAKNLKGQKSVRVFVSQALKFRRPHDIALGAYLVALADALGSAPKAYRWLHAHRDTRPSSLPASFDLDSIRHRISRHRSRLTEHPTLKL